jgi:2-C-methyl-D-erythritol 4-phosphate cytidylyltransferase
MISAMIVAAGYGARMKNAIRKQYLDLEGMPILALTLMKFNDCPEIEKVYLVVPKEDFCFCESKILKKVKPHKPVKLVPGGETRQESVFNGLMAIKGKDNLVVIHDGVRPFISFEKISKCISAAKKYGAAILAIPVDDTLKKVNKNQIIVDTVDRKNIWHAQTPQAFRYELIMEAFTKAKQDNFSGTDDASLVERMGKKVKIIEGDRLNIKITTPEDIILARSLIKSIPSLDPSTP